MIRTTLINIKLNFLKFMHFYNFDNYQYNWDLISLIGLILRWLLLGIFINNRLSLLFTLRSLVNIELLFIRNAKTPCLSFPHTVGAAHSQTHPRTKTTIWWMLCDMPFMTSKMPLASNHGNFMEREEVGSFDGNSHSSCLYSRLYLRKKDCPQKEK